MTQNICPGCYEEITDIKGTTGFAGETGILVYHTACLPQPIMKELDELLQEIVGWHRHPEKDMADIKAAIQKIVGEAVVAELQEILRLSGTENLSEKDISLPERHILDRIATITKENGEE